MSSSDSLAYHLLQYASHHDNAVNIGIYLICIPLITEPLLHTPTTSTLQGRLFQTFLPNAAVLTMAAYCLYYIKLDKVAGLITAPLFMGLAKLATEFNTTRADATKVVTLVQIVAWIAQLIGHGVYEKRAPKLQDNLMQALVLTPYLMVYEVLLAAGYRPKLKAELAKLVETDIREFRAKTKKQ
ncbi:hypothetical protein BC939DRAFT_482720 [Gamsiella multidivaricata]|uniref:uncharacterized protein n=1 Tax=Gamsiella multidivaricata TaxID=101098 RepID=UPI00221E9742|nr:uncharacterized protein BC939DRAFT_482720 [Gamsiella multidivaricata]KAI7832827.1 hypothetical protein BC939DRAFT_482720 [Gamsiella multidivaricata]